MAVPLKQTIITDTVNASTTKDVATDEIRYGPIGIVAIYPYSSTDANWELLIGGLRVGAGKCFDTKWDGNQNKLIPVFMMAENGEVVELKITNNDSSNSATVEVVVFYIR